MSGGTKTKSGGSHRRSMQGKSKMSSGATPIPCGPGSSCGHETCEGGTCRVSYVGPTSHLSHHYALHAARGVAHIWSAAVISGLAVVLTGAIAFSAVQAKSDQETAIAKQQQTKDRADWVRVVNRLDQLDRALSDVRDLCAGRASSTLPTPLGNKPEHTTSTRR